MLGSKTTRSPGWLVLGPALGLALASPVSAQTVAPDRTGTGGGPASTITAPNTTRLGVTKPPGDSLGRGEVPTSRERRRERTLTDRIERSICDGCN